MPPSARQGPGRCGTRELDVLCSCSPNRIKGTAPTHTAARPHPQGRRPTNARAGQQGFRQTSVVAGVTARWETRGLGTDQTWACHLAPRPAANRTHRPHPCPRPWQRLRADRGPAHRQLPVGCQGPQPQRGGSGPHTPPPGPGGPRPACPWPGPGQGCAGRLEPQPLSTEDGPPHPHVPPTLPAETGQLRGTARETCGTQRPKGTLWRPSPEWPSQVAREHALWRRADRPDQAGGGASCLRGSLRGGRGAHAEVEAWPGAAPA